MVFKREMEACKFHIYPSRSVDNFFLFRRDMIKYKYYIIVSVRNSGRQQDALPNHIQLIDTI